MNHETLKALYQLDVAEAGEEEAAKRWEWKYPERPEMEAISGGNGFAPTWDAGIIYRRKPGIPWPKVMQEPAYPEGEVVGPCLCGGWPGGECLHCPVVQQPVDINPETMLKLISTINYLVGIAERGVGRRIKSDETPEQFVLDYVKSLEAMKSPTQWPDDAPEWANAAKVIFYRTAEYLIAGAGGAVIKRPKPKDYCGVCGEWLGGPVECCGESHLKPPVTKDEATAVRAARKPAKQKIDWSKLTATIYFKNIERTESHWVAWNCDEHTRGNPLPDGLVVEWFEDGDGCTQNKFFVEKPNWELVTRFRIVGIQENWE